jgi:hypothetical protein
LLCAENIGPDEDVFEVLMAKTTDLEVKDRWEPDTTSEPTPYGYRRHRNIGPAKIKAGRLRVKRLGVNSPNTGLIHSACWRNALLNFVSNRPLGGTL